MQRLGIKYRDGERLKRDPPKAAAFFQMAADRGHAFSSICLADMLLNADDSGDTGIPTNNKLGVQLMRLVTC